ncbi:MAG: DUF362 domain-containing protein [Anaerolineae bacterium]|nr:DUF362 domain-containing protein [Anaerolineae bacterium]
MTFATKPCVALVSCPEYELERVELALRQALELLGGIAAFVRPGQRVLLKANLVRAMSPDHAATTHPTVVAAVARLVREAGAHPLIADSPGGPYTPALLRMGYRTTEMLWAAEVSGAELNYDVEAVQVSHPEAQVLHRLDLIKPALDVDVIINLPKLKTHNLTGLTLAVKNLFGLVPGALKIGYHAKLQQKDRFCEGLLDILTYARPALHILDAIVAMEGEGPSGGDPRFLGALLVGADALAVDTVAATLVGFDPLGLPVIQAARRRGLTTGRIEDVELLGESLAALSVDDFRRGTAAPLDPGLFPRGLRWLVRLGASPAGDENSAAVPAGARALPLNRILRAFSSGWLWRQMIAMPQAGSKCVGCGYCVRHCPVQAIELVDGIARMDGRICIRCYCCHELCPHMAVELHTPWLGKLLLRAGGGRTG